MIVPVNVPDIDKGSSFSLSSFSFKSANLVQKDTSAVETIGANFTIGWGSLHDVAEEAIV